MADPTIQTFCCYHGNGSDVATRIVREFNVDGYNTVCLFSSALGILGAIYQILPRQQYVYNHRWISLTAARGRKIIIWLAVADLLASVGVFTRSSLWLTNKSIMPELQDNTSVLFCTISSAWIQYFYTSTWIWTLCYTIDIKLVLSDKSSNLKYYHLSAWIVPACLTTIGLSLLYMPDAQCHTSNSLSMALLRILPNYFATYIPITLVMIVNPILYKSATKDMERVITALSGQFTSKEREIMDSIKMKFSLINLMFYICWVPNLINGVLIWVLWFQTPIHIIVIVWYIMALLNPLQALFNCLVYRRWARGSERVVIPWQIISKFSSPLQSMTKSTSVTKEETVPLLENRARTRALTDTELQDRMLPYASNRPPLHKKVFVETSIQRQPR
ncbi:hypothetical protein Trydic_g17712 [Trypoxylus dichotomus]